MAIILTDVAALANRNNWKVANGAVSWVNTAARGIGPTQVVFSKASSSVGRYDRVGGHHVHAKAAFRGHATYDKDRGFSLSQQFMRSRGWSHEDMSRTQRRLFDNLADSGKPNTLREHTRIAVEALQAGGATRVEARSLVAQSLWDLRAQMVRAPTRIPWN